MASIKDLKKAINELTYEVVSDCFTHLLVNGDKNRDKVLKIISETVSNRNELVARLNRSHEEEKKRPYIGKIKTDLIKKMDHSFLKLSKLSAS